MRSFALIMLLITLGSAQDDAQTSPASTDYQSGFARGLELGMEVASLLGAASFSPEAAELFNQTALEFNRALDQVFGHGSNLSNLYRLRLYCLKANNDTNVTEERTTENTTLENTTIENAINENRTAENHTAKDLAMKQGQSPKNETINAVNETDNAKEPFIPKLVDNATVAVEDIMVDDLDDALKNWDGSPETAPESMGVMPGPDTV